MSYIAKKKTVCFILISSLLISLLFSSTQSEEEEYSLKAQFIRKINNYIEWPNTKSNNQLSKYFNIGIIGETPIFKSLKQIYKNQKLLNKDIKIKKVKYYKDLQSFDMVFVSEKNKDEILKIVNISKKYKILLIGDTKNFAQYGIHINFYIKNEKIRFQINRNSLLDSGLSASSFLLSLAKIVNTKGDYK